MRKSFVVFGICCLVIVSGFTILLIYPNSETVNLDMNRMHGTVSTAMGSPILGNPSASITIIEFGDYQCNKCYQWFHETKPAIMENYIETGKANMVFVDLAFLDSDSAQASRASYCAEEQEMYWEFHNAIYNFPKSQFNETWIDSLKLKEFASDLNLDMDLFESCLDSEKYSKRVEYNFEQARKHGVDGTPGFFIVGPNSQEQFQGAQPFSTFKQIMDKMI